MNCQRKCVPGGFAVPSCCTGWRVPQLDAILRTWSRWEECQEWGWRDAMELVPMELLAMQCLVVVRIAEWAGVARTLVCVVADRRALVIRRWVLVGGQFELVGHSLVAASRGVHAMVVVRTSWTVEEVRRRVLACTPVSVVRRRCAAPVVHRMALVVDAIDGATTVVRRQPTVGRSWLWECQSVA